MARKQKYPVALSESEREELQQMVKTGQQPAVERSRQNGHGNRTTPFTPVAVRSGGFALPIVGITVRLHPTC